MSKAISDDEAGGTSKLYMVADGWCFVAQATRASEGIWHGYPVPGAEVEERVLGLLERTGIITGAERRRLRKQKALPDRFHRSK